MIPTQDGGLAENDLHVQRERLRRCRWYLDCSHGDGRGIERGEEQKCETPCETSRQMPARGGHDAGTRVIPGERVKGNPVLKLSRAGNACDDAALP